MELHVILWIVVAWIVVALGAALVIARIAAAGEHERRMATLRRDVARSREAGPGTADAASIDSQPQR